MFFAFLAVVMLIGLVVVAPDVEGFFTLLVTLWPLTGFMATMGFFAAAQWTFYKNPNVAVATERGKTLNNIGSVLLVLTALGFAAGFFL